MRNSHGTSASRKTTVSRCFIGVSVFGTFAKGEVSRPELERHMSGGEEFERLEEELEGGQAR